MIETWGNHSKSQAYFEVILDTPGSPGVDTLAPSKRRLNKNEVQLWICLDIPVFTTVLHMNLQGIQSKQTFYVSLQTTIVLFHSFAQNTRWLSHSWSYCTPSRQHTLHYTTSTPKLRLHPTTLLDILSQVHYTLFKFFLGKKVLLSSLCGCFLK